MDNPIDRHHDRSHGDRPSDPHEITRDSHPRISDSSQCWTGCVQLLERCISPEYEPGTITCAMPDCFELEQVLTLFPPHDDAGCSFLRQRPYRRTVAGNLFRSGGFFLTCHRGLTLATVMAYECGQRQVAGLWGSDRDQPCASWRSTAFSCGLTAMAILAAVSKSVAMIQRSPFNV